MYKMKKCSFSLICILFTCSFFLIPSAQADWTLTTLHQFSDSDNGGTGPYAGLIMDSSGNLYGTTAYGGQYGHGTVFKIDPQIPPPNNITILHSFAGTSTELLGESDGAGPFAGLVMDSNGNLYGTTQVGGSCSERPDEGCGTVFMLEPSKDNKVTILHSFAGRSNSDGQEPRNGLAIDSSGNLYGTTFSGGNDLCDCGTVFSLNPKVGSPYNYKVLHSFVGGQNDGRNPWAELIVDTKGNVYGTTYWGGSDDMGTVFKMSKGGKLSLLHSFFASYPNDGRHPQAGLIMDAKGNIYGTTGDGGSYGVGTVFKIDKSGKLSVLHDFAGYPNDGAIPHAGLIMDSSGKLYGTTYFGGGSNYGTVFSLNPKVGSPYSYSVLFSFGEGIPRVTAKPSNGGDLEGRLVIDSNGNLYGTTFLGVSNDSFNPGSGTVFKLNP